MGLEVDFARLIDHAPKVTCPGCHVEMTLRMLTPVMGTELYRAMYRCPQCGTDSPREFAVEA